MSSDEGQEPVNVILRKRDRGEWCRALENCIFVVLFAWLSASPLPSWAHLCQGAGGSRLVGSQTGQAAQEQAEVGNSLSSKLRKAYPQMFGSLEEEKQRTSSQWVQSAWIAPGRGIAVCLDELGKAFQKGQHFQSPLQTRANLDNAHFKGNSKRFIWNYLFVKIHPTGRCIVPSIPSPIYPSSPRRQHTWRGQKGRHHI